MGGRQGVTISRKSPKVKSHQKSKVAKGQESPTEKSHQQSKVAKSYKSTFYKKGEDQNGGLQKSIISKGMPSSTIEVG